MQKASPLRPPRVLVSLTFMFAIAQLDARAVPLPAQSWPMYQYSSDRNAVFDSPDWNVRWSSDFGARMNGGLAIVGNTLYVESLDGALRALDPLTGAVRWVIRLDDEIMNCPIVASGVVIAGTGSAARLSEYETSVIIGRPQGDAVVGFDASTGAQLWRFQTVGENMPTGVLATAGVRPEFVFANGDAHVYALDPSNGALIWKTAMPGEATMSSLALYRNTVYGLSDVLTSTPYLHRVLDPVRYAGLENYRSTWALDPRTAKFLWVRHFGYTDSSPAVGDGMVFDQTALPLFGDPNSGYNIVYGADAAAGNLLWKFQGAVGPKPPSGSDELAVAGTYADGTYYESMPYDKEFVAFDAATGAVRWRFATKEAVKMSALIKDGTLYVGDTGGYLYVVRISDGTVLRAIKFPKIFTAAAPVIVGATLFVPNDTTLYAVPLRDLQRAGAMPF